MKVLITVSLLMVAVETSAAQNIADIARQERARQQQVLGQTKGTYTNGTPTTVPSKPIEAAPTSKDTLEKKDEAAAKPSGPLDNQGRDEKYWKAAFQKARDAAKRADDNVEVLEGRIRDLNLQLLRQSDIYNREYRLGAEITDTQKELDAAKLEASRARLAITNLEEELRRSGGLPGWAR